VRRLPVLWALTRSVRLANLAPREYPELAWSEPRVGQDGEDRRVARVGRPAHRLDGRGREGPNLWGERQARLSHDALRVVRDSPRLGRALEDCSEQRHSLADRMRADSAPDQLALESGDGVGVDLAKGQVPELRRDVAVVGAGVGLPRSRGEVRGVSVRPRSADVLVQGLPAGVHERELASALAPGDLRIERVGVALAADNACAVAAGRVAPAHAVDGRSIPALDALDAHPGPFRSSVRSSPAFPARARLLSSALNPMHRRSDIRCRREAVAAAPGSVSRLAS
jgi:hypothetical protein